MKLATGRQLGASFGVTALAVAVMFAVSTWGLAAWNQARVESGAGSVSLPGAVDNAPASVATTSEFGPVGTVSMVYAGTEVYDGLLGELDHPWLAVSARSGDYRALDAPQLPDPAAGAVAVDAAGERLAWATGDGVELYDPVTDTAREVALEAASRVGRFSPDGELLTVHAGGLRLLDVTSGEVVAEADGSPESVARRAAWRADGSAVDWVEGRELVTLPVDGSEPTTQATGFDESATLAWAPTGETLVGLQEVDGINRLLAAPMTGAGALGEAEQLDTPGIALDTLLGFSGQRTVAVSAYLLESGAIERVLDVPMDGGSAVDVTTLPSEGENWVGSGTLAVSAEALRAGSTDFGNVVWPWSHRARLVACVLVGVFGLGLWLTRRPRAARRRR